jgi:uncharacterized protein (DUF1800 family)
MSATSLRLSRRQALGLAAGGAVGAAGLRLVTLHLGGSSASTVASAAGSAGAWSSPLGDSRALAAHLLRRAGFGYSDAELDSAASLAYDDLVAKLVNQQPDVPAPPTDTVTYTAVSQWWYQHMATTQAQFPERMLLFWHGVLTSDFRKTNRFPYIYQQNQLYRRAGAGDLRTLLLETTYDPAMMRYLDLDQSTVKAPNENYSRELMELFTLGVGNYTETDVREGARALSGLRIQPIDKAGAPVQLPKRGTGVNAIQDYYKALQDLITSGVTFRGVLMPRAHDNGTKTYLGRSGNLGAADVIDAILAKDACANFIANKALLYFSVPNPSNDYVSRIATTFRNSKYDIKAMMTAIFRSDEFKAAANYRSLVRSPADFAVATMRALGQPDIAKMAVAAGSTMDQILYDPPTVGGWPVNGGWISSGTWLARMNFAHAVVNRGGTLPDPVKAVHNQLDGVVGADTASVFNGSQSASDRWFAILGSPEFHLK